MFDPKALCQSWALGGRCLLRVGTSGTSWHSTLICFIRQGPGGELDRVQASCRFGQEETPGALDLHRSAVLTKVLPSEPSRLSEHHLTKQRERLGLAKSEVDRDDVRTTPGKRQRLRGNIDETSSVTDMPKRCMFDQVTGSGVRLGGLVHPWRLQARQGA